MDTKTKFIDAVKKLLNEEGLFFQDAPEVTAAPLDGEALEDIAERVCNIAETYFETPAGLVEIRGNLEKVMFEPGKMLKIAVSALNSPENRQNIFSLQGNGLTLRACQYEIPMDTPADGAKAEAENPDEHPGQATLEEWDEGYPEAQAEDAAAEDEEAGDDAGVEAEAVTA